MIRNPAPAVPRRALPPDHPGRGRARPIRTGYRPQLFVGATDVTATLGMDAELSPGGRAAVALDLDRPVALEPGVRFALREGGRTIGAGVVTATQ